MGDPIEVAALSQAYGPLVARGRCLIGSAKTNIGHLDTAAGVAGLIKASLVLQHRQVPPSLHFEQPNPKLQLEESPFRVATGLTEWEDSPSPRRAGNPRRSVATAHSLGAQRDGAGPCDRPSRPAFPAASRDRDRRRRVHAAGRPAAVRPSRSGSLPPCR
jgi:hypothetical protein